MSRRRSGEVPGARLVYSTGPEESRGSADCAACGTDPCCCDRVESLPPGDQTVLVRAERSGRRGKTVTIAGPLFVDRQRAAGILKKIKRGCGSGGTLKVVEEADGRRSFSLEIQGNKVQQVLDRLVEAGFEGIRR